MSPLHGFLWLILYGPASDVLYLCLRHCMPIKTSMNSNNWLLFPLSLTHSSLPPHLHTTQSHNFSLGLVHDNLDNTPFPNQEWSLIGAQGNNDQVPKVADILGVSKSDNSSDLVGV